MIPCESPWERAREGHEPRSSLVRSSLVAYAADDGSVAMTTRKTQLGRWSCASTGGGGQLVSRVRNCGWPAVLSVFPGEGRLMGIKTPGCGVEVCSRETPGPTPRRFPCSPRCRGRGMVPGLPVRFEDT